MRIISGTFKGRKVYPPKHLPVRPTTDRAREALFNILNNNFYFNTISVLDLFAGTGCISYEFASRGTQNITSVDKHLGCLKFIKQTSEDFNMDIKTVKSDVVHFLKRYTIKTSIIFADPPYAYSNDQFAEIISLVFNKDLLEHNGLLIVEHSKHTKLSHIENFTYSRSYSNSVFSFFYKNQSDEI